MSETSHCKNGNKNTQNGELHHLEILSAVHTADAGIKEMVTDFRCHWNCLYYAGEHRRWYGRKICVNRRIFPKIEDKRICLTKGIL
jgi:hypothetical protein